MGQYFVPTLDEMKMITRKYGIFYVANASAEGLSCLIGHVPNVYDDILTFAPEICFLLNG